MKISFKWKVSFRSVTFASIRRENWILLSNCVWHKMIIWIHLNRIINSLRTFESMAIAHSVLHKRALSGDNNLIAKFLCVYYLTAILKLNPEKLMKAKVQYCRHNKVPSASIFIKNICFTKIVGCRNSKTNYTNPRMTSQCKITLKRLGERRRHPSDKKTVNISENNALIWSRFSRHSNGMSFVI